MKSRRHSRLALSFEARGCNGPSQSSLSDLPRAQQDDRRHLPETILDVRPQPSGYHKIESRNIDGRRYNSGVLISSTAGVSGTDGGLSAD